MVQMLCIACGSKVAFRVRSCSCGHVLAENLIVPDVSSLYWKLRRHANDGVRKLTSKIRTTGGQSKSEMRKFYLSKYKEIQHAKKVTNKKSDTTRTAGVNKTRKGMLLLEERKRKLLALITSPQYQERLSLALLKINKKLLSQKRFSAIINNESITWRDSNGRKMECARQLRSRSKQKLFR